jgi:hypothetical protein
VWAAMIRHTARLPGSRGWWFSRWVNAAAPATTAVSVAPAPTSTSSTLKFTMNGVFSLAVDPAGTALKPGDSCRGSGSFSDVSVTTSVHVFNGTGQEIATGYLGPGSYESNPVGSACVFPIKVTDVPDGLPEYWVEIGQRGEQPVPSPAAHSWVFLHA